MVNFPELAEYVRNHSTKWYNAGYESPAHEFAPEELEVVEMKIEVTSVIVRIPTVAEYAKVKYEKTAPGHYKHVLNLIKKDKSTFYSIYDLKELMLTGGLSKFETKKNKK